MRFWAGDKRSSVILLAIFQFLTLHIQGQELKTVSSEYCYIATQSQSIEEAKKIALQRAMMQAIADEFGTSVSMTNSTKITNIQGKSAVDFKSYGLSDLRGEWIETIGTPEYDIVFKDQIFEIRCKVKGRIREKSGKYVDLKIKMLKNAPSIEFESTEFHNGDNLYMFFQSPVPGFLSIYYVDEEDNTFCILPYDKQAMSSYPVDSETCYFFFSKRKPTIEDSSTIDEYVMTCGSHPIQNRIFVVYSPNKYSKAIDSKDYGALPRNLTYDSFMKWLSKTRINDKDMIVKTFDIEIKP